MHATYPTGHPARMLTGMAKARPPAGSQRAPEPPPSTGGPSLAQYLIRVPRRGATTDAVGEALREAILEGVISPGTWLREDSIAQELKVSRTPVREALRRLADDGLVVKTAHYGSVVAPLSLDDILALYVVRGHLEGLAARLAAQRLPAGLLERLEEVQHRMARAAERQDYTALPGINLEFHRALRAATGNTYLERFLLQVEHAVRRLRTSTFELPGRTEEALREHSAIIAAIAKQDPDEATRAAQHHMSQARDARIRAMLDPI